MFEDLSARSKLDGEEIARLKKERDELLQRNAAANEKASEVLKELEMERDLRRKAESRATALQRKVDEDVEVVRSLRAELDDAVKGKSSAENAATKLEKEVAYTRRALQVESDEHDLLQAADLRTLACGCLYRIRRQSFRGATRIIGMQFFAYEMF